MPYVFHSVEVKERVVALWDDPHLFEHVIDALGVSHASVYRWKKNYELYGSVLAPNSGLQGRPSIVTSDILGDIQDLLHSRPDYYIDEIQQWLLIACGISISTATVHRCILDAGYTFKLLRLQARLRNETEINHFKSLICNTILATHIMATDETSKDGRTLYRCKGYVQKGETATKRNDIDRGKRWSLLPVMSTRGYEAKRVIAGSVDTLEFNDFIFEDVLPLMNPWPQPRSVLLLDNCRIHKSQLVEDAVRDKGCILLFIPPYAPELNPIEESFSCVKACCLRDYIELGQLDPADALEVACKAMTPEKATAWIKHAGYL